MKKITVVTPCYNEQENIRELYRQVKETMAKLSAYSYEHFFIDNASRDQTVPILREIANQDSKVKVIVNNRNFGHIRSPYHALLQARGDAVILIAADLQDPPSLIPDFVLHWEQNHLVVVGVKTQSDESAMMFTIRTAYYNFINRLSDIELTKNTTGFGLYDKTVIETLRTIRDPYPYFRGLISELGFDSIRIPYHQPARKRGITKNNFYTLYDIAMVGITNHSKIPLRVATLAGFIMSGISLVIAIGYLIAKVIFWSTFQAGTAPILIGLFFFSSVQLFFTGIIGEYIGAIHTQILNRPHVIEKERIGTFDSA